VSSTPSLLSDLSIFYDPQKVDHHEECLSHLKESDSGIKAIVAVIPESRISGSILVEILNCITQTPGTADLISADLS
jgi:hypothetical protein